MAAGTYVKGIVIILASVLLFGASSSTIVHEAIWDSAGGLLGDIPGGGGGDGDGNGGGSAYYVFPEYADHRMTLAVWIDPDGGTVNTFTLNVCQAVSFPEQTIWDQDINCDDPTMYDFSPRLYNMLDMTNVDPFTVEQSFTLYYEFTTSLKVWDLKPSDCGVLGDIDAGTWSDQLSDQTWTIEGADVGIDRTAVSAQVSNLLSSGEDNALTLLHDAYLWVVDNIDYYTVPDGGLKPVAQTLADGNGDCDDMSTLLISMARGMGIPAWMEMGYLYSESSGTWVGHAWVRALVPLAGGGYELIAIDPANKQFALYAPNRLMLYSDYAADPAAMKDYYLSLSIDSTGATPQYSLTVDSAYYARSPNDVHVPANHSSW